MPDVEAAERIGVALSAVADRSSGSDELAAVAAPGWDEFHFGGAAANVVRPLGVRSDERVLVLGAGSGGLVRYAADVGAQVVGVESDAGWLAAARARTRGCDGVELLDTLPQTSAEPFDLVLIAASPELSPLPQIDDMLEAASARLADDGIVAVAVPNLVSVAELAGFDLGDLPGVSTGGTAPQLAEAFQAAGLTVGATLHCYPDVFTTHAVLTEDAYAGPDAVAMVDQIVGAPVSGSLGQPFVMADDRALLRALVASGAGPETSPGLLVVGAKNAGDVGARLGENAVAWRFTGGRLRAFQQQLTIEQEPAGLIARRGLTYPDLDPPPNNWLQHTIAPEQPYVLGENLEQQALAAMTDGDSDRLGEVLSRWVAELEEVVSDRPDIEPHPFLSAEALRVLPPDHVDVGLDNFTDSDGSLVFIDREWRATGGVELELAAARALWKVAVSTVRNGSRHLWAPDATVGDVWVELVALTPIDLDTADLERWWIAEGELLAIVTGANATATANELRAVAARSRVERAIYPAGVEASAAVQELDLQVRRLTDQLTTAYARMGDMEEERAAMAERLEELRGMLPVRVGRAVRSALRR